MRPSPTIAAFLLAACSGCASPHSDAETAGAAVEATAEATIENGLPYDGCSWPVTIAGVDYAPDAASLPAVRDFMKSTIGKATARVHYRPTGRVGRVECGWGSHRGLPEISLAIDGG